MVGLVSPPVFFNLVIIAGLQTRSPRLLRKGFVSEKSGSSLTQVDRFRRGDGSKGEGGKHKWKHAVKVSKLPRSEKVVC